MSDPYVRDLGFVTDIHGREMRVKVDYDSVVIGAYYTDFALSRTACEEFARLFVAASWEAGLNATKMVSDDLPLTGVTDA